MKKCGIEGCDRKHEARGYCKNHYKSFIKYNDPLHVDNIKEERKKKKELLDSNKKKEVRFSRKGSCIIDGCENPIKAKQMCDMHYSRKRRTGKVTSSRVEIDVEQCLVIGCNNPHKRKGLCSTHLSYLNKYNSPYLPQIVKLCGVKGCDKVHLAKGLCQIHYNEWAKIKNEYGLDIDSENLIL